MSREYPFLTKDVSVYVQLPKTSETERGDLFYQHSKRVMGFSALIGQQLGFTGRNLKELCLAAILHDIGKTIVDRNILMKPGPLNDEEKRAVRVHVERAGEALSAVKLPQSVLDAIYAHHERWDGDGYPHGLKGVQIPLEARIIAVADAFDVMTTTERPYRVGVPKEEASEEIQRNSGSHFCPDVVQAFLIAQAAGV